MAGNAVFEEKIEEAIEAIWRGNIPSIRPFLSPKFPKIVCLCGSTRFAGAYIDAMRNETLAGNIVLTVGLLGHQENLDMEGQKKKELDELHLRKIDLADEVLILNVDDYIGKSTGNELRYARAHGKAIRFLEPHKD